MNKKGGMDEVELKKYVKKSITHLHPDACNIPGKWFIAKVNSRPGQLNMELLVKLWLMGFHLYPGVPNTTAIMQETDHNYGPFKTAFYQNLGTSSMQGLIWISAHRSSLGWSGCCFWQNRSRNWIHSGEMCLHSWL